MMHENNCCEKGGYEHCHMGGPMKKEFKLALLAKKEKILGAELEFIVKMKDLVKKMPDEKE